MTGSNGLPCNLDAERFVLGSILLDDQQYELVASRLVPEDFLIEKHRSIFRRMGDLHGRSERIDWVTVFNELLRHGEAESCDGLGYLVSLDDGMPQIPKLDSYVRIVKDKSVLRSIIFASHHMMNRAMSGAEAPEEIRSGSQEVFAGFTNGRGASGYPYRIGEVPSPFKFAGIVPNYIREPELPEGNLVVLTGNSESGKSSLAYAWARDANIAHGIPFLALDCDNPVNVVANRLARLHIDDGPQFQILGGWLGPRAPQPDSPLVLNWVKNCNPKPIVEVDSMGPFLDGGDENDASVVRAFFDRCRRVTDLGATLIAIHNNNREGQYRGSSALHDAADVWYSVTNLSANRLLDKLYLDHLKHRFGRTEKPAYDYNDGRFTSRHASEVAPPIHEQLTAILRLYPGVNGRRFDELVKAQGLPRNEARAWLDGQVLSKKVRREDGPNNSWRHFLVVVEDNDAQQ